MIVNFFTENTFETDDEFRTSERVLRVEDETQFLKTKYPSINRLITSLFKELN
jgi:hypothetical protein